MILVANIKNMKQEFADYMRHDDRVSIHGLTPKFRDAERGASRRAVDEAMTLADNRLMGHGIEAIRGAWVNNYWQDTVALYVNMGDTYAPTIIYDTIADRFYVGGYGDWVEWRQENREYDIQ